MKLLLLLLTLFAATPPLLAYLVTSKDGTKIYADAKGNPAHPHFVWIHGFPLSTIVWNKLFDDDVYLEHLYMVRDALDPLFRIANDLYGT